jgi:hypothetical protein
MVLPSKPALKQELLGLVSRDLDTLVSALRTTRAGATHEEAKPENDKDTRALEQSYLARGQAARVEELRHAVEAISTLTTRVFDATDPVALGALATLCEADVGTDFGARRGARFVARRGSSARGGTGPSGHTRLPARSGASSASVSASSSG